jgi:microcystin-dependent protein
LVETTTKNYAWVKPEIQHSPTTWGGFINNDLDSIDGVVFSNQQGLVPVGSGALWFTNTPPANWLICNGQSLATIGTYAALFAVIGYTYGGSAGNFNLPNFTDLFPIGVGANALAARGGASTVTLDSTMIPAHAHPITDVSHNHGLPQSPHSHSDSGHGHGAGSSYQDAHNHTVVGQAGGGFGSAQPPQPTVWQGSQTTSAAQPALHIAIDTGNASIQGANANISIDASGTGLSTTQNAGGGLSHPNMPPFLAINLIIRFQ